MSTKIKRKTKEPLRAFSIRLSQKKLGQASGMKIQLGGLFRDALDKAIEKGHLCSACGQPIEKPKSKKRKAKKK